MIASAQVFTRSLKTRVCHDFLMMIAVQGRSNYLITNDYELKNDRCRSLIGIADNQLITNLIREQ